MKKLFFILLTLPLLVGAQTSTTKAKLRTSTGLTADKIFYITEGPARVFYQLDPNNTVSIDDDRDVIVNSGGQRIVRLEYSASPTSEFSASQLAQMRALIGAQVRDSLLARPLWLSTDDFIPSNTKEKPLRINWSRQPKQKP